MTSQPASDCHPEPVHREGSAVSQQFPPHAPSFGQNASPATGDVGGPMLMSHGEDATRLLLAEPIPCGSCGVMHTFFINRGGKTRCFCCDQAFQSPGSLYQGPGRPELLARAREEFRLFAASELGKTTEASR